MNIILIISVNNTCILKPEGIQHCLLAAPEHNPFVYDPFSHVVLVYWHVPPLAVHFESPEIS